MANKVLSKDMVDLYADTDRGIISDDSASTLRLENVGTGNVLVLKSETPGGVQLSTVSAPTTSIYVVAAGTADAAGAAVRFDSAASLGHVLELNRSNVGSPTIANLKSVNSTASGAHFEFAGFLASTASMGSIVRGVRVKYGDNYGWLPIYASATFI